MSNIARCAPNRSLGNAHARDLAPSVQRSGRGRFGKDDVVVTGRLQIGQQLSDERGRITAAMHCGRDGSGEVRNAAPHLKLRGRRRPRRVDAAGCRRRRGVDDPRRRWRRTRPARARARTRPRGHGQRPGAPTPWRDTRRAARSRSRPVALASLVQPLARAAGEPRGLRAAVNQPRRRVHCAVTRSFFRCSVSATSSSPPTVNQRPHAAAPAAW